MTLTREQIAALTIDAADADWCAQADGRVTRHNPEWRALLLDRILALLADRAAAEGRGAVKGEMPRIDWDHEPTSTLEMVPCSVCGERKEYCACTRGAAGETA